MREVLGDWRACESPYDTLVGMACAAEHGTHGRAGSGPTEETHLRLMEPEIATSRNRRLPCAICSILGNSEGLNNYGSEPPIG
eukprot:15479102-Alexandrium_andersonii.AAC.1